MVVHIHIYIIYNIIITSSRFLVYIIYLEEREREKENRLATRGIVSPRGTLDEYKTGSSSPAMEANVHNYFLNFQMELKFKNRRVYNIKYVYMYTGGPQKLTVV